MDGFYRHLLNYLDFVSIAWFILLWLIGQHSSQVEDFHQNRNLTCYWNTLQHEHMEELLIAVISPNLNIFHDLIFNATENNKVLKSLDGRRSMVHFRKRFINYIAI